MQTRGRCGKCGEPRCRTHCKCGRRGTAQGRSAPRPPRNASASTGASASNTPIRPRVTLPEVAAVGAVVRRPAPVSVEVFTESALWIDAIIKEMGAASAMCVASYIADDERFCNAVLTRLQGRRPFTCQVVVDDATFRAGTSRHQRARLRQLQLKKGASVQLGRGKLKMKSLLHLTPVYATGTPAAKLGARAHAHSALAARRAALAPLALFQHSGGTRHVTFTASRVSPVIGRVSCLALPLSRIVAGHVRPASHPRPRNALRLALQLAVAACLAAFVVPPARVGTGAAEGGGGEGKRSGVG